MPYLIDGHNLIPKLPGFSLSIIDDEIRLVKLLQDYCRRNRRQVDVYFDNAPAGQAGRRIYGAVIAHFIAQGRTADDAISARLEKLGRNARNWSVVSSDQRVQRDARAVQAKVIPSEKFAQELLPGLGSSEAAEKPVDLKLSPEDVADWLKEFTRRK